MITVTLAQLKSDIASKMKGTSIREVKDFYGTAAAAANRMLSRVDTEETRRTVSMSSPFYDNVQDYALVDDFKRMIDIRPTSGRKDLPGGSHFLGTTAREFDERMDANSFSIRWNNMVRTIRAQRLPTGNVITMDTFESPTVNGSWSAFGDASGLYIEPLNFVQGSSSLGFNLSGSTGTAYIENSTAEATDLSSYRYEDSSFVYFWIPTGFSSKFTNFKLRRGSSSGNYVETTITTRGDGTAFRDGWNFLRFDWNLAITVGTPDNTQNTYRRFTVTTVAGTAIPGVIIDSWTNSLGTLYEIEYYSEYLFRTAVGTWIQAPTSDTDLVNVSTASYEILKAEMMVDITQQIRIGNVQAQELAEWRHMLDGQLQSRYVRDVVDKGLYFNYSRQFPSSAIVTRTSAYTFDI